MHMKPFYESSLFLNHYWGRMNHGVCQTCTLIRRRTRPGSRQTEWIGNPSARRCSNAVGSFLMNSMWTLGRTRLTVEKHACCFFWKWASEVSWGAVLDTIKLNFCMFCSYLIWSMNPLGALVCLHHVQLGINRMYRSHLIPPIGIDPPNAPKC